MQASTAIMLGDSVMSRNPRFWVNQQHDCGCAIGRAYVANGGSLELYDRIHVQAIIQMWPWLNQVILNEISCKFYNVCAGLSTIEDLADWVRKIEPKEDETVKESCLELAGEQEWVKK